MQRLLAPLTPLRTRGVRPPRPAAVLAAAAALAAGAAAADGAVAVATAAGAVAAVLAVVATRAFSERDVFNPAVIVAVFLVGMTAGRVAYVVDHGEFGLGTTNLMPLAGHERTFALAALAQLAAAVLFAVGVARARPRPPAADRRGASVDTFPLAVALLVVTVASAVSIALLVREAGGLHPYVDALGYRQRFFEGRGWLLAFPTMLPGLVLAWLAARLGSLRTGNGRALAAGLVGLGIIGAASTGTRSSLVFLFAIPALTLFHVRVRRISLAAAAVVAVAVFVGVGLYRETLRNHDNRAVQRLYRGGPAGLVVNTFASPDAQLPDPVAVLMLHDTGPKWGTTIASAALAPVPRRVWPGKPTGGNNQFTRLIAPQLFAQNKTEYAITLAGELVWNFWWPGLLVFAALGLASGVLYRRALARAHDPVAAFAFAAALGFMLMLLRGDVYNSVIGVGQVFGPGLVLLWLGQRIAARP